MVDKPVVSPGYFRTIGIRLRLGRDFTDRDTSNAPGVVIISESVARQLWRGADPIGKRISMEDHPGAGDWLTIIGVVDDIRQQGLTQAADPAVYQPYAQVTQPFFPTHMTFAIRTAANPLNAATAMRAVLRDVDQNQPAQSISTMRDVIAATTTEPRFQSAFACGVFSACSVTCCRGHLWRAGLLSQRKSPRDRHPHGARSRSRKRGQNGVAKKLGAREQRRTAGHMRSTFTHARAREPLI
jgi:putative ABC transport system permease protein